MLNAIESSAAERAIRGKRMLQLCKLASCDAWHPRGSHLEIGNFKRIMWPANEWAITVRGEYTLSGPGSVGPSRKLQSMDKLMMQDVCRAIEVAEM